MDDLPGLVVCRWCIRLGPAADGFVRAPHDLESVAMLAGWRFDLGTWLCRTCIDRQASAAQN